MMSADNPGDVVVIDTTALLASCLNDSRRDIVTTAMRAAAYTVMSESAMAEALCAVPQICDDPYSESDLINALHHANDRCHIAAVDTARIHAATGIARRTGVRLSAAIHLDTAMSLGERAAIVTFDPRQITAAIDLDIHVISA